MFLMSMVYVVFFHLSTHIPQTALTLLFLFFLVKLQYRYLKTPSNTFYCSMFFVKLQVTLW